MDPSGVRQALRRGVQRRLRRFLRGTSDAVTANPAHTLGLVLVGAVGVALRLYGLGAESLWVDEAITLTVVRRFGTLELVTAVPRTQPHLPPYYVLLDLWVGAVGDGDAVLRGPSAVFSVAVLPFVYALGARLFDRRVGLLALAVTALSRLQLYYAQEARMYAMLLALTVASYYCLLRRDERWWAAGYVGTAVGAAYVHPFGGLGVLGGLTYLALAWRLDTRGVDTSAWPGTGGGRLAPALVGLALVPLVLAAAREFATGFSLTYLSQPGAAAVARSLLTFFGSWSITATAVAVGGLLALLGAVAVGAPLAGNLHRDAPATGATLVLACWAALPVVVLVAASHLLSPVFWYRYALPAAPAYYLLVARGGIHLSDRVAGRLTSARDGGVGTSGAATDGGPVPDRPAPRLALALRIGLAVLLVLALTPSVVAYHTTDTKDQWEEAVGAVEARAAPGDLVLVDGCMTLFAYERYQQRDDLAVRGVVDLNSATGGEPTPPAVVERATRNTSTVWTVVAHVSAREERRLRRIVPGTHRPAWNRSFVSIDVTRYEQRAAAEGGTAGGTIPSRAAFGCQQARL